MTVLVKILLTPALIAAVTLLARRWGPAIGGTIAGLPLTSAPVSVFLLVEQGPVFAVAAAGGTLLGLLSQGALCLAYAWAARRMRWPASAAAGVAAFVAATLLLRPIALGVWPAFALVSVILLATAAGIRPAAPARDAWRPPRWDLAFRMLAATAMVVVLTALAPRLGPTWTGLLSARGGARVAGSRDAVRADREPPRALRPRPRLPLGEPRRARRQRARPDAGPAGGRPFPRGGPSRMSGSPSHGFGRGGSAPGPGGAALA